MVTVSLTWRERTEQTGYSASIAKEHGMYTFLSQPNHKETTEPIQTRSECHERETLPTPWCHAFGSDGNNPHRLRNVSPMGRANGFVQSVASLGDDKQPARCGAWINNAAPANPPLFRPL